MAKRDTYKYELTKMRIVGNISTLDGASKWESNRIKTYMNNHNGNTPLYNQNEHGK